MYELKKSLGQHFLTDENICRRIVGVLDEESVHHLLEVGPGGGALTKYILKKKGINFKAIEIDTEKVNYLQNTYPELKSKIINQDILEAEKPFEKNFTVIGNFPYNISSQILFKMIEWKENIDCVIGMFQKEVAQRVAAKKGNKTYGVTSVLVQAYFKVEYLFEVNENCFTPPPKVKSAVIKLTPLEIPVNMKDERSFRNLVKAGFNQRRKTLRNATKAYFDPVELSDDIFNMRAEQLSVEEFGMLSFKMK